MQKMYIITGAKGHLASTIIKYLRGTPCLIRGLILPGESAEDEPQVRYYKGDVTKIETMDALFSGTEGYETVVIHAAGIVSIGGEVTKQMYSVNVEGTRNVVAQCRRYGVGRLLYISSVHAIPETDRLSVIEEVSHFSKELVAGAYAKTKAEATQIVMDAIREGMDAVIVHPSGIVGPYDEGNNHVVQLVQSYLSGHLPGGVTGGYDFVDVRDVAQGCISAATKGRSGECYILSNRYCTVKELLEFMRAAVGGRRKICFPLKIAKLLAPLFEAGARLAHRRPLFTKYSLYTMGSNGRFSHDKATAEFGYHPRDMKQTIFDTIRWLRHQAVPT